jgi:hypothetical protein
MLLGERVSLVKVFRLGTDFFLGVQSVNTVSRCTTSYYLLAGPTYLCDALLPISSLGLEVPHQCFSFFKDFDKWLCWLTVCVKLAAKIYIQHTLVLPVAIHKTSVALRVLVNGKWSISLSILQFYFIFIKIPQTLFVIVSHQTHLMREIW